MRPAGRGSAAAIDVTVVIPWYNRRELATSLRDNVRLLRTGHREIVIVNCGGDRDLLARLVVRAAPAHLTVAHVDRARFNKGLALNVGVSLARGRVVSCLDSDVILQPASFAKAAVIADAGGIAIVKEIRETRGTATTRGELARISHVVRLEARGGRQCEVETGSVNLRRGTRSAPGLITLRRADFLAVGGMNSRLTGWGWEDLDLLVRLQLELGKRSTSVGTAIHLTHGWSVRSTYNEPRNRHAAFANYDAGRWRGSYAADVRACRRRLTVERG
jgi:glycosyltransferase involved in cell wall biosynthesis